MSPSWCSAYSYPGRGGQCHDCIAFHLSPWYTPLSDTIHLSVVVKTVPSMTSLQQHPITRRVISRETFEAVRERVERETGVDATGAAATCTVMADVVRRLEQFECFRPKTTSMSSTSSQQQALSSNRKSSWVSARPSTSLPPMSAQHSQLSRTAGDDATCWWQSRAPIPATRMRPAWAEAGSSGAVVSRKLQGTLNKLTDSNAEKITQQVLDMATETVAVTVLEAVLVKCYSTGAYMAIYVNLLGRVVTKVRDHVPIIAVDDDINPTNDVIIHKDDILSEMARVIRVFMADVMRTDVASLPPMPVNAADGQDEFCERNKARALMLGRVRTFVALLSEDANGNDNGVKGCGAFVVDLCREGGLRTPSIIDLFFHLARMLAETVSATALTTDTTTSQETETMKHDSIDTDVLLDCMILLPSDVLSVPAHAARLSEVFARLTRAQCSACCRFKMQNILEIFAPPVTATVTATVTTTVTVHPARRFAAWNMISDAAPMGSMGPSSRMMRSMTVSSAAGNNGNNGGRGPPSSSSKVGTRGPPR